MLSNAINFTKEGNISIISEKNNGQVTISVKDTGRGIDLNIFPRLFTKFATKSDMGTGLGLYF